MAQLKFSLKTSIIESLYFDIYSNMSKYYYAYGRSFPWETVTTTNSSGQTVIVSDEENPPAISQSYSYELGVRRDILYAKAIDSNDSAIVARRINWTPGLVYDMYDDYSESNPAASGATSIEGANFYVLTSDFNVYKCLFNNNNSYSSYQPSGTSSEATVYPDNYIWKFMYTIPLYLRNKFLTTNWMPCTTALTNQFYSNGAITSYSIENKGANYVKNTWKVSRINIVSGGIGYSVDDITITFPNPDIPGGTLATASVASVNTGTGSVLSIVVTEPGSGYTSQPVPTITQQFNSGTGLSITIDYDRDSLAYTELKIYGDGYNANNPYTLKTVTIKNGGEFIGTNPPADNFLTFPSPTMDYGYIPEVDIQFSVKSGSGSSTVWEVSQVVVTNPGYGYTSPLIFGTNVKASSTLQAGGFVCDLNASTQKNEAELVPLVNDLGEIESLQIKSPGKGYTYATAEVIGYYLKEISPGEFVSTRLSEDINDPGYLEGFKNASIVLNLGYGDIETKQSNVELLAVDGSIDVIVVENGGYGYGPSTTITITGDGTGCEAVPVIVNGSIVRVQVNNPGSGYTYARATVNGIGSFAELRTIIAPLGGHGKNAVSELFANSIMLVGRIGAEKTSGLTLDNDYRQISIIKNPKIYDGNSFFTKATGTACALVEVSPTTQNLAAFNAYRLNDVLTTPTLHEFILVNKYVTTDKYYLLLEMRTNYLPTAGTIFQNQTLYNDTATQYPISISSSKAPDFDKYSGEMLYIDNRVMFTASVDQTIVTTTLISF